MNHADGHKVVIQQQKANSNSHNKMKNVPCTRWEEVTSTLSRHANFSALMKAPTAIRMVQNIVDQPQQLGIASSQRVDRLKEISRLAALLQEKPSGIGCDLLPHLQEVVESCIGDPVIEILLESCKCISIIYVTDRLPVDENGKEGEHATNQFLGMIKRLSSLPFWIVIRLSTDNPDVVNFYNDLDNNIANVDVKSGNGGINLDVLDDFVSEAAIVNIHNLWLNYAYPLHLCRESAVNFPVFDLLNDRPLTHRELVDFINLLFDLNQIPSVQTTFTLSNPKSNYAAFRAEIKELVKRGGKHYDPIKRNI
mmetsp:Transcript_16303/g.24670  ORF Transcript_16303/g.24670 Transcript_16303/m.24670 type:complete len:309 (-) Transcript_16303:143-1069(-)